MLDFVQTLLRDPAYGQPHAVKLLLLPALESYLQTEQSGLVTQVQRDLNVALLQSDSRDSLARIVRGCADVPEVRRALSTYLNLLNQKRAEKTRHAQEVTATLLKTANFVSVSLDPIREILPPAELTAVLPLAATIRDHFASIFGLCDRSYPDYKQWISRYGSPEQKRIFDRIRRPDYSDIIEVNQARSFVPDATEEDLQLTPTPFLFSDVRYPENMTRDEFQALLKIHPWECYDDTCHPLYRGDVMVERATQEEFETSPHTLDETTFTCVIQGATSGQFLRLTRLAHHPRFQFHFEAIAEAFEKAAQAPGLEEITVQYFREMAQLFREGDMVKIHRTSLHLSHPRLFFIFSCNLWYSEIFEGRLQKTLPSGTLGVRVERAFSRETGSVVTAKERWRSFFEKILADEYSWKATRSKESPPNENEEVDVWTLVHLGEMALPPSIRGLEHGLSEKRQQDFFQESLQRPDMTVEERRLSALITEFHEYGHRVDIPANETLPGGGTLAERLQDVRPGLAEGLAETAALWQLLELLDSESPDSSLWKAMMETTLKTYLMRYLSPLKINNNLLRKYPHAWGSMIILHEFIEAKAFSISEDGTDFKVTGDLENFKRALDTLSKKILSMEMAPSRKAFDQYCRETNPETVAAFIKIKAELIRQLQRVVPPLDPLHTNL